MSNIRFLCYGDSLNNLKMSIRYHVIGLKRPMKIGSEECLYLVCKFADGWNICGKAQIGDITEDNPFDEPEKYYTYRMTNLELCVPYEIGDLCRTNCGKYWGLMLQRPEVIKNEHLLGELEKEFVTTGEKEFERYIGKIWDE